MIMLRAHLGICPVTCEAVDVGLLQASKVIDSPGTRSNRRLRLGGGGDSMHHTRRSIDPFL